MHCRCKNNSEEPERPRETLAVSTNMKRFDPRGQATGCTKRTVLCFGMRAGIFPRRDLVEVYGASCTYNDVGPLYQALSSAPAEKKKRLGLSLPPRLVGANEGGTDRPVYALPLSGSCRASTPKCTLHCGRCSAVFLSFSLCSSVWCYEILSSEKQAPFVHRTEKKKGPARYRCATDVFFFFLISDARNIYRCARCCNASPELGQKRYIKFNSFLIPTIYEREDVNDAISFISRAT